MEIAPTNANRFLKAIEKISESAGLIQTSGVAFTTTFPVVKRLMEVLEELHTIQGSFEVVESGRGRSRSQEEPTPLTTAEVEQLEAEVAALPVQALAQPATGQPEPPKKLSHFEQLQLKYEGIETPGVEVA